MTLLEPPSTRHDAESASASAPPADVIEPKFWTGTTRLSPDRYSIDAGARAVDAIVDGGGELGERIRSCYHDTGLVVVTGTGLTDADSMRSLARLVLDEEMRYDGGANPRRRLSPNVYEVGAPPSAWLHYHHEMAYVSRSTAAVAFLALDALPAGRGRTFVSDNLAATDALLATPLGQKLNDLGLCYHRKLTDREEYAGRIEYGVYNHWQRSFGTEDPAVAAQRAEASGLEVEWGPNRVLHTRYLAPAYEYFPRLDRNVLYASVADHAMWFDTWPLVEHLPVEHRPLDLTFGDGSAFTRDELQLFVDVYDRFGTPIDWSVGDVAVICNYRFAHGRPRIDLAAGERRELGVVLGPSFDRVGVRHGRW